MSGVMPVSGGGWPDAAVGPAEPQRSPIEGKKADRVFQQMIN